MLGTVGLKCCVRLHGVPGRQRKFFESVEIFESVSLSFTRSGTNAERIQSVFDKTSVRIRIFYAQTWNENEDHGLLTPIWPPQRSPSLCRALVILRLLLLPSYGGERGILVRSLFFQKNTISPRRSYNFKWQDIYVGVYFFRKTLFHLDDHTISNDRIYMLELIFLSQVIFVFLLFLGMVMYAIPFHRIEE